MSNVSINDNGQIVVKQLKRGTTVEKQVDLDSKTVTGIYSAIRNLIAQLIISNGKWVGKVQKGVMLLVKELIEFSEGYKNLAGADKKALVMLVLNEIFNKELDESELDDTVKALILQGIDIVVEPALEIALYAAKGNINLLLEKAYNYPYHAFSKGFNASYRFILMILLIYSLIKLYKRESRDPIFAFGLITLSYLISRTLFFSLNSNFETRYMLTGIPFIEIFVCLTLCSIFYKKE